VRVFICSTCEHELDFESMSCSNCDSPVGYVSDRRDVVVLVANEPTRYTVTGDAAVHWRCLNASWGCNWMLPADEGDVWCLSCRLTRGRPDEADPVAVSAWSAAEAAKRRLVFQLGELGLPIEPRSSTTPQGLAFDLVHIPGASGVTGHDRGIITLDLNEADERHRDELRRNLGESFRTLIGHLRHEVGHYYFTHLVRQDDEIAEFRALFGDERIDYSAALDEHYRRARTGTDASDHSGFVTGYAAAHPLEDWAETFAHYLHTLDGLQTADSHGLSATRREAGRPVNRRRRAGDEQSYSSILERWLPVAEMINAIADGLGSSRPYPFTLSPVVVTKLEFVHACVTAHSDRKDTYAAS
jgi:hypothetical protein